ncbi:MAG TPA: class E sortase [Solirubrobacterales bacterium]|nr:class E sortase [Solirubrobacterales bacterium]
MSAIIAAVHRVFRILSVALITAGLVVLADVAATLAWKEPVSSIYGSIQQGKASDQLDELERSFPSRPDLRRVARVEHIRDKVRILAGLFADRVHQGEPIGRIAIPSIGLDVVAVEGTDTGSLQKGPGHYPQTPLPGRGGTSAFAGHRTTYLAPFRHLDQLGRGDRIELEMPYANFAYRVQKTRIVDPDDVGIVHGTGYERLVLTACHPLYSAAQRIAVFAKLTRVSFFAIGPRRWIDP